MTIVPTLKREILVGYQARRLRVSSHLTQEELSELAGVRWEHVVLLEHNLPVPLDSRRKIFKELWARKIKR